MNGPRDLFHTISAIMKALFEKEQAYLSKQGVDLITRNSELGGTPDGFRFAGVIHTQLVGAARGRGNYGPLDDALVPEMFNIKSQKETMEFEMVRIKQALSLVLRDCQTPQDVRDALPNSLKNLIPGCAGLERTRPEAFTIVSDEKTYSQYMNLREKIEYYVASMLLH